MVRLCCKCPAGDSRLISVSIMPSCDCHQCLGGKMRATSVKNEEVEVCKWKVLRTQTRIFTHPVGIRDL